MAPSRSHPCELILALDVPREDDALRLLDKVGSSLQWVKIGLQLFTALGPRIVEAMHARGYQVFLDLKLHDIPNTVAKTIESLCQLPVTLTTLHTMGGSDMLIAADEARQQHNPSLNLLGVTVLTSHNQDSLAAIGMDRKPEAQVRQLAHLGLQAGLQGLVCSPLELDSLRAALGPDCLLVTPGIRPMGADLNDQKRATTPAIAARAGSSYIVVGRPILQAPDPKAVVESIQRELTGTNSNA